MASTAALDRLATVPEQIEDRYRARTASSAALHEPGSGEHVGSMRV